MSVFVSIIPILPFIVGLYKYRTLDKALKLIWLYAILSLGMEGIVAIISSYTVNNLALFHIFTVIEFLLFVEFFKLILKPNFQMPLSIAQIAFSLFAIVNSVFIQSITENNTYPKLLGAIILILLSLAYFYTSFENQKIKINTDYRFYITVGILLFYAASLVVFSLENYLTNASHSLFANVWKIQWIANILLYILLATGLWIHKPK